MDRVRRDNFLRGIFPHGLPAGRLDHEADLVILPVKERHHIVGRRPVGLVQGGLRVESGMGCKENMGRGEDLQVYMTALSHIQNVPWFA